MLIEVYILHVTYGIQLQGYAGEGVGKYGGYPSSYGSGGCDFMHITDDYFPGSGAGTDAVDDKLTLLEMLAYAV